MQWLSFSVKKLLKVTSKLLQCINIQWLKFNGFLFSKSDETDLLPYKPGLYKVTAVII